MMTRSEHARMELETLRGELQECKQGREVRFGMRHLRPGEGAGDG